MRCPIRCSRIAWNPGQQKKISSALLAAGSPRKTVSICSRIARNMFLRSIISPGRKFQELRLERGNELFKGHLILSDGPGRARKFKEHRALWSFDDGAQQAVIWFGRRLGLRHRTGHAGISARNVDGCDLQTMDRALVALAGFFGLELADPAVHVG